MIKDFELYRAESWGRGRSPDLPRQTSGSGDPELPKSELSGRDIGQGKSSGRDRSPALSKRFMQGYHFITIVIFHRIPIFKNKKLAEVVKETLHFYENRGDYELIGFIVMPDHIHFICNPVKHISEIVRDIKKYIAKLIISQLSQEDEGVLLRFKKAHPDKRKYTYQIWQKGFYDFNILTQKKLYEKLKYMYENPLRKGLCKNILEYRFSDIYRYFGSGDPNLPKDELSGRDRSPDLSKRGITQGKSMGNPGRGRSPDLTRQTSGSGDPELPKSELSGRKVQDG